MSEAYTPSPNGNAARALAARGRDRLALNAIEIDGGTQSRANLNQEVITEYATALASGAAFPAVVVFYDGARHWLADGFHRFHAHREAGVEDIEADVRQGTRRDAVLYSVGANENHGLRRTNDDKRRAVMTLLNDSEWSQWSDREIARRCCVGHPLVAAVRVDLTGISSSDNSQRTYTTKHGTQATMNTAAVGKRKKKSTDDNMNETPTRAPNTWVKIAMPDGANIADLCREGIQMENDGATILDASRAIGLAERTYATARLIVMLADHDGFSERDTATAKQALETLADTLQIQPAWEIAEPLAVKYWGEWSKVNIHTLAARRFANFEKTFGIVMQGCMTTDEIDLPYLNADQVKAALRQIGQARGALARFADRIKEIHE